MPVPTIITSHESDEITCHDFTSGTVCWFSKRSPDKTTDNEDALMFAERDDGIIILAVADGVGGQPGGGQAAKLALNALAKYTVNKASNDAMSDMIAGIDAANHAVINTQSGSATTLAAVMIDQQHARSFHIGDSEIFICGQRGKVKFQTIPHSPTGYAVESGILSEDEALAHEDRYLVSNLVGSNEMRIELGSVTRLSTYDSLLICTDGVTDNLVAEDIVEHIRKGDINEAANRLSSTVDNLMRSNDGKPDDLSFLLFRNRK